MNRRNGNPEAFARAAALEHVNLEDADPDAAVLASQHGGVSTLRKISHGDGRLGIIRWLEPSGFDRGLVGFPIVVRRHGCSIPIMQFEHWVCERIGYAEGTQRGTDSAH